MTKLSLTLIVAGLLLAGHAAVAADHGRLALDNQHLRIEVDPANGAIARILDKQGQIDLGPPADLRITSASFCAARTRKTRQSWPGAQKTSKVLKTLDRLTLAWNGPFADTAGGKHQLDVRMEIRLEDEWLEFRFFLQNGSPGKVAQAWYPLIGGLGRFGLDRSVTRPSDVARSAPLLSESACRLATKCSRSLPRRYCMSFSSVYNTAAKPRHVLCLA